MATQLKRLPSYILICLITILGAEAQQVIFQADFDDCSLPQGWQLERERGDDDWQFGLIENGNAWASNSMDGTCFAFFDDDGIGEEAPISRAKLISPAFNGADYANFYLDLDLIFRRYADLEHFGVMVLVDGEEKPVFTIFEQFGGEQFNEYEHLQVDLSSYRAQEMRIVLVYDDGNDWGWWVGVDNIVLSGEGTLNDLCDRALAIDVEAPCNAVNNKNAFFEGGSASCADELRGGIWYKYEALETQDIMIETGADFNDQVSVFEGSCNDLTEVQCANADEYGFAGETPVLNAQNGSIYWIRVSGTQAEFGEKFGNICVELKPISVTPESPEHDQCANAIELTLGANCKRIENLHADFQGPEPSYNIRSRSDVWYSFVPTQSSTFEFLTQANFSDVITLFSGDCGSLSEIKVNEKGTRLLVPDLISGTSYYLQISGSFSTIEGELCVSVKSVEPEAPVNDVCQQALPLSLDGSCVEVNNSGASDNGPKPSCDYRARSTTWYSFQAPASGIIYLNSQADYQHSLSVYSGSNCDELEEIACLFNPRRCDGDQIVSGLQGGMTYLIAISSIETNHGVSRGEACLRISDNPGNATEPLSATINEICDGNGKGTVQIIPGGGSGNYSISGQTEDQILVHGEEYTVVLEDDAGCQVAHTAVYYCPSEFDCDASPIRLNVNTDCLYDDEGVATGDAQVSVDVEGGVGNYTFTRVQNGAVLADGDYYKVVVFDENGCSAIEEGVVFCAASPCLTSDLSVDFKLDCNIDFFGNHIGSVTLGYQIYGGQPGYSVTGESSGQVLVHGSSYSVLVTDALGCQTSFEGIVDCPKNFIRPDEGNAVTTLTAAPNPAADFVSIGYQTDKSGVNEFEILDILGRHVKTFQHFGFKGENKIMLNISNMSPDIYLVRSNHDGKQHFIKIVKR